MTGGEPSLSDLTLSLSSSFLVEGAKKADLMSTRRAKWVCKDIEWGNSREKESRR